MGAQLLLEAGRETNGLVPRQTFIPWTTINGKHDENEEKVLFLDAFNWACRNFEGPKPAACA